MEKEIITLDASLWKTISDFYGALFAALGSPEWHGANVNALVDTMIWSDEINTRRPPYAVRILNTEHLPPDLNQELRWAEQDIANARMEFRSRSGRDVDVSFEVL